MRKWMYFFLLTIALFVQCTKRQERLTRALWESLEKNECPTFLPELKEFYPDLVIKNPEGQPFIHLLAEKELYPCLEEAIRLGCDLNQKNNEGENLLFFSAKRNLSQAISLLYQNGFDLKQKNDQNKNATEVAVENNAWQTAELLSSYGVYHPRINEWLKKAILQNNPEALKQALKLKASIYQDLGNQRNALMLASERGYLALLKIMVTDKTDVNATPDKSITATTLAFANRHLAVAKFLMEQGGYDPTANPLLFSAIDQENVDKIEEALERGANPNGLAQDGNPPLIYAYLNNKPKSLEKLFSINRVNLNQQNTKGDTLLLTATRKEDEKIIQKLINSGADVNLANNLGYTPLIYASAEGYEEIVEILLKANADVHRELVKGGSAIYWAKERGHERIVKMLLKAGAIDPENFLALINAVKNSDVEGTRRALASRVNINARNKDGYSAIMFAAHQPKKEIVEMLIKAGANLNVQESEGYTPLMIACWNNFYEIAELLLKNGADTKLRHKTGRTALMIATWKGSPELVKLLAPKSEINAQDNDGWTALMFAANEGNLEKIKILLSYGAEKNLKNNFGQTAKDIAQAKNLPEITAQL